VCPDCFTGAYRILAACYAHLGRRRPPHLKEIEQSTVGMASIGGAGTFDGIVLSGIVAAYLA
jgi:hypothetical protein